jgi:adenylate cyclase
MAARPSLDIDLLRSFVLIAEGESFTRAAERVGRTQSAVSLQMQRLESLVGHRLFERSRGAGVRLTPEGGYLLERARELLSLNDDILGTVGTADMVRDVSSLMSGGARSSRSAAANFPSIAVVPFQDLSEEPRHGVFADGIVDGIIGGLSRIKWLVVIARGSTLGYKGRAIDVRQVGRELSVRYVLQGSVRCAGSRVRIAAHLLDAETRRHLWTETYDGVLEDVFDLHDEITGQIVGILESSLQRFEIERARRRPTQSLDAFSLYLRALPCVAAQMPQEAAKALPLLRRALTLDPDYAAAHALLAWGHELCFTRGGMKKEDRDAALFHARTAIASETDDGTALATAGFVMALLTKDHDQALPTIDRGLSMNPSSATILYLGAQANALTGKRRRAMSLADRALRLSPRDTFAFQAHMALGEGALEEERFDDAAACFARATQAKPVFSTAYVYQAIALAQAGRPAQATNRLARGFELEPGFSTRAFFEHGLGDALRASLIDGARLLELPV